MEVKPPRILVIDDDPEIRSLLGSMLRREGFPVCTVGDGPSALELIGRQGFDLLIGELRAGRHGDLRRMGDGLVEQAVGGLAGHDGSAVGARFEGRFP